MTLALKRLILSVILCFGRLEAIVFLDDKCYAKILQEPVFQAFTINGRNADRAPWMAYLIENGQYICGGSLVNSHFVLTAAHCVKPLDNFYARLGEYDSSITTDGLAIDFKVINFYTEPRGQDIALLKLAARLMTYTATIQPICIVLPGTRQELEELYSVNHFHVTGWGQTSRFDKSPSTVLQEISVSRINSSLCGNSAGQICCENPSQFVCHGDSGSPLTSAHRYNHVVQYGILSSGHEKCYDHAKYVDIVPYTAWIVNTINNNF